MWPPNELFLVVVTIKPARASRDIARMNRAITTSISEKPFDLMDVFIVKPLIPGTYLAPSKSQTDALEKANSVP
jgi:hypothetical protein